MNIDSAATVTREATLTADAARGSPGGRELPSRSCRVTNYDLNTT